MVEGAKPLFLSTVGGAKRGKQLLEVRQKLAEKVLTKCHIGAIRLNKYSKKLTITEIG